MHNEVWGCAETSPDLLLEELTTFAETLKATTRTWGL